MPACIAGSARAGTSSAAVPRREGGIYKSIDGGDTWTKLSSGLPSTLIGKIDISIARSQPSTVYAMVEAPGGEGGLYKSGDAGASWKLVNNAANLRTRPFYFHYVDVNPKDPNEVWVNTLDASAVARRRRDLQRRRHAARRQPRHLVQPRQPELRDSVQRRRRERHHRRRPHLVEHPEPADRRALHGRRRRSASLSALRAAAGQLHASSPRACRPRRSASIIRRRRGRRRRAARPAGSGRRRTAASSGAPARARSSASTSQTGQAQGRWIYPQDRYGHHPDDIKFRFPRQTVIMVSPHDPKTVYQASHVLHRSTDDGVTWQVISPDLTAHEKDYQVVPGRPITRDVTGEEVYSSIYSMDESPIERGVIWVGANDGPVHVTRDSGKTWKNVTPPDLPPGGRVQNIDASAHPQRLGLHRGLSLSARARSEAVHLQDRRLRRDVDEADRRRQRHPGRSPDARRPRGSGTRRPALCRHRVRHLRVVRQRRALAAAAAEPARHAGHRHPRPPRRSRHRDDGAVVLDHGRHRAAPADGGSRQAG